MKIRIDIDRGFGWRPRQSGDANVTKEDVIEEMRRCAIQYPHRAYVDDALVAEAFRPYGARGKARIVRYDGA